MYLTIEDLQTSVERLKRLRMKLSEPGLFYNHQRWSTDCGSPSCALGWATVLFPGEIALQCLPNCMHYVPVTRNGLAEMMAGIEVFRLSEVVSGYLFDYYGPRDFFREDMSVGETIRRIRLVENYHRRKLAILLAEREAREAARKQPVTV